MTTKLDLSHVLAQRFGLDSFRPGQREVIEFLLAGHSSAAVFPTGGGKSLCYQLPSLLWDGLTLVVSPLTALMKDQIDAMAARDIAAARLDATLTSDEYRQVVTELRSRRLRMLYVSPERFNNERFRELISGIDISLFAVDEAHCISEWGHNFRPDYLKLARHAEQCRAERILALTATAPPKVLGDICREFAIRPDHAICTDFYRLNLRLLVSPTSASERDQLLVERLRHRPTPAIVYVTLQKTAEVVSGLLLKNGVNARHYHAGLSAELRTETQEWFQIESNGVIVATIAFGMGIDKSDIRAVYHYNVSKSIENFAQEIGRAGRDGADAVCETFWVAEDLRTLESFVHGDLPDPAAVHSFVADVFSRGTEFGLSTYHLSRRHDIRDLVLRTLLTYLELDGYLESGSPYYAEYRFKPLVSSSEILKQFRGEPRDFLAGLFHLAKPGRTWLTVDIDKATAALKTDRNRIVRALDHLAERELVEIKAAGVHSHYRVMQSPDIPAVAESLYQKAVGREHRELARLNSLVQLFAHDGCQASALGSYFGQPLPQPCGHCGWCESGTAITAPPETNTAIDEQLWQRLNELRGGLPDVFSSPRSLARFACGITSPLLAKEKLTKHELFGCMRGVRFVDLLERMH